MMRMFRVGRAGCVYGRAVDAGVSFFDVHESCLLSGPIKVQYLVVMLRLTNRWMWEDLKKNAPNLS